MKGLFAGFQINTPAMYSITPAMHPNILDMYPITPAMYPITPAMYTITPAMYPITPTMYPITPAMYPITPAMYPITPAMYPITPAMYPITPIKWLVAWLVVVVVINHTNTDSIVFDNLSEVIVYYSSTSRIKVCPKFKLSNFDKNFKDRGKVFIYNV